MHISTFANMYGEIYVHVWRHGYCKDLKIKMAQNIKEISNIKYICVDPNILFNCLRHFSLFTCLCVGRMYIFTYSQQVFWVSWNLVRGSTPGTVPKPFAISHSSFTRNTTSILNTEASGFRSFALVWCVWLVLIWDGTSTHHPSAN